MLFVSMNAKWERCAHNSMMYTRPGSYHHNHPFIHRWGKKEKKTYTVHWQTQTYTMEFGLFPRDCSHSMTSLLPFTAICVIPVMHTRTHDSGRASGISRSTTCSAQREELAERKNHMTTLQHIWTEKVFEEVVDGLED